MNRIKRFCSVLSEPAVLSIDVEQARLRWVFLGMTTEGSMTTRREQMGDDNVRFVILFVMGIVLAGAVFFYFIFMSNIHIG